MPAIPDSSVAEILTEGDLGGSIAMVSLGRFHGCISLE